MRILWGGLLISDDLVKMAILFEKGLVVEDIFVRENALEVTTAGG